MNTEPKIGDYVLATKWNDGDPGDHWAVGFYESYVNDRYRVVDNDGKQIRAGGFRRIGLIDADTGAWLLSAADALEKSPPGSVNMWSMLSNDD